MIYVFNDTFKRYYSRAHSIQQSKSYGAIYCRWTALHVSIVQDWSLGLQMSKISISMSTSGLVLDNKQ